MTMIRYTHRNGETDLPTITGHFWVDRTLTQDDLRREPEIIDQYDVVHVAYEYFDEDQGEVENIHIFVPAIHGHVSPENMPEGVRWWGPLPSPATAQDAVELTFTLVKKSEA